MTKIIKIIILLRDGILSTQFENLFKQLNDIWVSFCPMCLRVQDTALFITAWVILILLPRKKLLVVEEAAALHDNAQNITHCYIPYEFSIQHEVEIIQMR